MWSKLQNILRRLVGASVERGSALLPNDVDKLTVIYKAEAELEGPGGAITAREAFELALEIVTDFDPQSRLCEIQSAGNLNHLGRAESWKFRFVLPNKRGHAEFLFQNSIGKEKLEITLLPFAAVGSALAKMQTDGQGGFVEQQWKVEMERLPLLSHAFQDSSSAIAHWRAEGKDLNFRSDLVLKAVTPPLGKARWELFDLSAGKKSLCSFPIE